MPALQVTRTTDKTPEQLWEVLADFPNIADWYGGLKASVSTSDAPNGVGATRHCEIAPIGTIDERILEWDEGRHVKVSAFHYEKAPIKNAIADFRITPTAPPLGVVTPGHQSRPLETAASPTSVSKFGATIIRPPASATAFTSSLRTSVKRCSGSAPNNRPFSRSKHTSVSSKRTLFVGSVVRNRY